ncbi:MAG: hypothetical protein Q8K35_00675 [Thiobacillus sp.]|nr:hypothetical protein [Thiobacillus sp.]MDP2056257.1 hypothetical protein [Thiobacillus sp.]
MTIKSVLLAAFMLMLGACAAPPERPAFPAPQTGLGASALLSELTRVAALSPDQRRRELAGLEGERRLDDARRFQLAALLEREDSVEALERGLKSLGAIDEIDSRARPLLELMKKSLKARIELKQQTAHAQELQDKLDQIKVLEKSLQQRNTPDRTP